MAPHVSRRRVGETWAAKYRAERGVRASATPTGGTSLSHIPMGCCVPQGGPYPHDLRAVHAADLSARGPPNGHARTMMGEVLTVRRVECRSSLKFITQATSTINPIYTLGKLVSLPLKVPGFVSV